MFILLQTTWWFSLLSLKIHSKRPISSTMVTYVAYRKIMQQHKAKIKS